MSKDKYFKMILADFNVTPNYLHQRKHKLQCSYEDIYNQLIEDESFIFSMQELCVDIEAVDIKEVYSHTKYPVACAKSFLSTLYRQDLREPIEKRVIENSIKVKEYLEGKKRNSLS